LTSPFEKGGLRGILQNNNPLILNELFFNKISPSPSFPKRGLKDNTFTASKASLPH